LAWNEVQDPVAEGGVQSQVPKLGDEFGGDNGVLGDKNGDMNVWIIDGDKRLQMAVNMSASCSAHAPENAPWNTIG
jgi:hypothetical protein